MRLSLPATLPEMPAPARTAPLPGSGVHVLTLAQPGPGTLLLAASTSAAPIVLALERAAADGWQTVALATGRSPVVAVPADGAAEAWRIETWTVDGGAEPIRLAARALDAPGQPGSVSLEAVDGMPAPVAVARAQLPDAGIARVAGAPPGLLAGGWPGHALAPAGASIVASGTDVWLVSSQPGTAAVSPLPFEPEHEAVLQLPAGLPAALQSPPVGIGQVAMWRVTSGSGQPNLGLATGTRRGECRGLGRGQGHGPGRRRAACVCASSAIPSGCCRRRRSPARCRFRCRQGPRCLSRCRSATRRCGWISHPGWPLSPTGTMRHPRRSGRAAAPSAAPCRVRGPTFSW